MAGVIVTGGGPAWFIEDFESFNLSNWNGVSGIDSSTVASNITGMMGKKCLDLSAQYSRWIQKNFNAASEVYFSFRIRPINSNCGGIFILWGSPSLVLTRNTSTGIINARRTSYNSTIYASSTNPLAVNTTYFIQIYFKAHLTAGRLILKINGNTEIDFTGWTTNDATFNCAQLGTVTWWSIYQYIDNFQIGFTDWILDLDVGLEKSITFTPLEVYTVPESYAAGASALPSIIRQEIPLIAHQITGVNAPSPEMSYLEPSKFTNPTYYFEIVAKNSSGSSTVALQRALSSDDATITVNSATLTRYRTAFTPPTSSQDYVVDVNSTTITVESAKIVILQNASELLATVTHFPIGGYTTTKANTTSEILTNCVYWNYDPTQLHFGTASFYAEACFLVSSNKATVTIVLREQAADWSTWSDKVTIVNARSDTTWTRIRTAFTPVAGRNYSVWAYISSNKYTYSVACCKIIAVQSKPSSSVVTYGSNATPFPKYTTITNNPVNPSGWQGTIRAIDLDSNYTYVLTNYNLYRVRKADDIPALCKTIGVSSDISAGLANDASYVYFARSGSTVSAGEMSRLWKGDWDTVSSKTLGATEININAVCADSNYVYAVTNTAPARVIRLLKSDWTTYNVKTLASGEDYGGCICQDANYVYVGLLLDIGKIVRVAKSDWSTTTTKTLTATEGKVGKICVDDNYVFAVSYDQEGVANQERTYLIRLNKSDFTTTSIFRDSIYSTDPGGVAVDDTYVYFSCRDRTIWLPAFRVSYRFEKAQASFTYGSAKYNTYYMYGTQYGDTGAFTYDNYTQNHFWYAPSSPPYAGNVIRYDKFGWCDQKISTNYLGYNEIDTFGLVCDSTDTYAYYYYYQTGTPYSFRKILLSNATSAGTLTLPAGLTPGATLIVGDNLYATTSTEGVAKIQLNPSFAYSSTLDLSSYANYYSGPGISSLLGPCYDPTRGHIIYLSSDPAWGGVQYDVPPRLIRIDLSSFTYHSHIDLTPSFPYIGVFRTVPCIDTVRGFYYVGASLSPATTVLSLIWKVNLSTFQQAGVTLVSNFKVSYLSVDESTGYLYSFSDPTAETSGVKSTPVMRRIDPDTFQVLETSRMSKPFGQGTLYIDPTKKRGYTICRTVTDSDQPMMNDYSIFAYDLTTMSYMGRIDRYVNPAYLEGSYMYYIVGPFRLNSAKSAFYHIINVDSYYTYAEWFSLAGLDGGESIELIYTRSDYQMAARVQDPAATGLRETYALWDPYEYGTEGAWAYSFSHYLIQPPFRAAGAYLQNKSTGTEISNSRVFGGGPTGVIDDLQQFQVYNGSYTDRAIYGGSGTNEFIVQSFRTSNSFYLSCASFEIKKTGTPTDNLRCDLYNDTYPSGLLAFGVTISGSLIDAAAYYPFGFKFLNPVPVGSTYFLKIYRTGARDTSNYYQIQSTSTAPPDNLYAAYISGSGSLGSAQGPSAFTISSSSEPASLPSATTINLDLYITDGGAGVQVSGVQAKNKQKRKFKFDLEPNIETSTSNSVALSFLKTIFAALSINSVTSMVDLTVEGIGAKQLSTLISIIAATPNSDLNVLREIQLNVPINSTVAIPNLNIQRPVSTSAAISSYTSITALNILRAISSAIDNAAQTTKISVDVLRYVTAALIISTVTNDIDTNLQRILTSAIGAQTLTSSVDLLIKLFFTLSTIIESSTSTYNLNLVRSLNVSISNASFTNNPLATISRTISELVQLSSETSTPNLNTLRNVSTSSSITTSTTEVFLNLLLSLLSLVMTNSTSVSSAELKVLREIPTTINNTTSTNIALLNVLRDTQLTINNVSVTSMPLLGLLLRVSSTVNNVTSTSIPLLSLLQIVLTSINNSTLTDVTLLNVLRDTQVNIGNATTTSVSLLNILHEIQSSIDIVTSTNLPLLGLLHEISFAINNITLTDTALLNVLRDTQVVITDTTSTSVSLLNVLRDLSSTLNNITTTSVSLLNVLHEILTTLNINTTTDEPQLNVLREVLTTIDSTTSTNVPLLNVLHQLEAFLPVISSTDTSTVDVLRQATTSVPITTSTPVIDITFFKQLLSTISSQVLVSAINVNVLRSVQSDIALQSSTSVPLLPIWRSLSNSVDIVTTTLEAALLLTKILTSQIDLETFTSDIYIEILGGIKYLETLIALATTTPGIQTQVLREVSSSSSITTSSTESLLSILRTLVSSLDFSTTTTSIDLISLRSITTEISNLSLTDAVSLEILRRLQSLLAVSTITSNSLLGLLYEFSTQVAASSSIPSVNLNVRRLLDLASAMHTSSGEPFLERLASLEMDINVPISAQEITLNILRDVETQIDFHSNTSEIDVIIGGILQLLTLMSLQTNTSDANLEFIRHRGIKLYVKLIQRLRRQ